MTYDQLVTLDTVVKLGSFKAAAEYLSKSQPSVSVAIKKLEEQYQLSLFSRDEYRPKLTDTGLAFYKKAQQALIQYQELDTFALELAKGHEPEINVLLDAICPVNKIAHILQPFFGAQYSTALNINIDLLDGLRLKLLEGEADLAIGTITEYSDQLEIIELFSSVMVPVITPLFYKKTKGDLKSLKKYPQIIVKSSAFNEAQNIIGKIKNVKHWYTTDMFMKEQLISSGLGWGRLPLHQVEDKLSKGLLSKIDGIPSIQTMKIPMHLMRLKSRPLGPNAKNLWNLLKESHSES